MAWPPSCSSRRCVWRVPWQQAGSHRPPRQLAAVGCHGGFRWEPARAGLRCMAASGRAPGYRGCSSKGPTSRNWRAQGQQEERGEKRAAPRPAQRARQGAAETRPGNRGAVTGGKGALASRRAICTQQQCLCRQRFARCPDSGSFNVRSVDIARATSQRAG